MLQTHVKTPERAYKFRVIWPQLNSTRVLPAFTSPLVLGENP